MLRPLALGCAVLIGCGGGSEGNPGDDSADDPDAEAGAIDAPEPDGALPGTPILVAVGYGQRRAHSFDGVAWEMEEVTPDGGDDDDLFRGLTFGGGRFVAVGGSTAALTAISTDGITWTPGGSAGAWLGDVAWNGEVHVAAGGNGLRVRSTDGGASWIDPAGYQAIHYRSVAYGEGVVVAVGHTYEGGTVGVIATTADGVDWDEPRRSGPPLGSIAYGAGVFVASGASGLVATSSDGVEWSDQTIGDGAAGVIFTGAEFVLSGEAGIHTSPDGLDWTPVTATPRAVMGYLDGTYLAGGWPLSIATSTDLEQWTPVWSPGGSGLTSMVRGVSP
jgi:hypothetical protein